MATRFKVGDRVRDITGRWGVVKGLLKRGKSGGAQVVSVQFDDTVRHREHVTEGFIRPGVNPKDRR